jgi:hypothetical protein
MKQSDIEIFAAARPNNKWVEYQPAAEWIDINTKRPKVGEIVACKVNIWRSGQLHRTEEINVEYIGYSKTKRHRLFAIDIEDGSYPEVTFWKTIKN